MKKTLICLLFLLYSLVSIQAQSNFVINGKIKDIKVPSKIILQYAYGGVSYVDSATIVKGAFLLKGNIDGTAKANLILKPLKEDNSLTPIERFLAKDEQDFFLGKGSFTVNGLGEINGATIKGTATQSDYLLLQKELEPLEKQMAPLSKQMQQYFKEKNEVAQKKLFPKLRAIRIKMNKVSDDFIYKHPDSYVSLDLVQSKAVVIDHPKTFAPFYSALSERLRNTEAGKKMGERLAIAKRLDIGQPAIDFTQNNTKGVPISLSSLKGKYVLIDFWASWCGPCRAENPNVVKAYNKFKGKNFEIIGVSLDSKKAPWLKAIAKDGLPWIHVSDLLGWKNEVAVKYGVKAVPQNFLIDPNGIIIGKNLMGEELEKILSKLIKKQ